VPTSTSTKVPLTTGQKKTGINLALNVGGSISGTVQDSVGGGLSTTVSIYANGYQVQTAYTDFGTGAYVARDLRPSATGYVVCFRGQYAYGGSSTTGYTSECYNDQVWDA
jgi:hypothetical protein